MIGRNETRSVLKYLCSYFECFVRKPYIIKHNISLETYVCNTKQHIHYKLNGAARLIHQSFKIDLWQSNVKHSQHSIMVLVQSIWDSRTGGNANQY